jgi:hypothetical protein
LGFEQRFHVDRHGQLALKQLRLLGRILGHDIVQFRTFHNIVYGVSLSMLGPSQQFESK